MAIARLTTAASVQNVSTLAHTVSAGSDRMLVACFGHEVSAQITVDSVDYGGQAMVQAVQIDTPDAGSAAGCSIWYLLETAIAAASDNVITPTYSSAPTDHHLIASSYTNVNQTGGSTTNPATSSAESNEPTPNPLIIDLTEANNGLVVAVGQCGANTAVTWGGSMTEQTDDQTGSSACSMSDRLSTSITTIDIEPTFALQNRAAACSASFAVVGGLSALPGFHGANRGIMRGVGRGVG